MRLFAVVAQLGDEPETLWTLAGVLRQPHEHALAVYAKVGGDRLKMRIAEFIEVAHAPTDRPPPGEEG